LIDRATSPGDMDAMDAFHYLEDFANEHPEFLYVRADTLEDGLIQLEKKALLWSELDNSIKEAILEKLDDVVNGNLIAKSHN